MNMISNWKEESRIKQKERKRIGKERGEKYQERDTLSQAEGSFIWVWG
jgi:hypothetical protein